MIGGGYLRALGAPLAAGSWCPSFYYDFNQPRYAVVNQQFVDRYSFAPSLALKLSHRTSLLLQYTKARDQRVTDFGVIEGPFQITSIEYSGSHDGEAVYELALASAGALSFAAI